LATKYQHSLITNSPPSQSRHTTLLRSFIAEKSP
jgi:hypothetical protein